MNDTGYNSDDDSMGNKLDEGWVCTNDGFRIVGQFCGKGIIPASVFGSLQVFLLSNQQIVKKQIFYGERSPLRIIIWGLEGEYECPRQVLFVSL